MRHIIDLRTTSFLSRTHRPGDPERVVAGHGQLYTQEYGGDKRFQELVAKITADFINQYDPASERCWVAERNGEFLGCVMFVNDRASRKTAKLHLLLLEPTARGLGLGRTLVQQCIQFAQEIGYSRITL